MKFNWGTGIAVFYLSFMAVMIGFVIKSKSHDHSLVVDNYYEEDLKYQTHYDKVVNGQSKENAFELKQSKVHIELKFPNQLSGAEGRVHFYRPSNSRLDFELPLKLDSKNQMVVSTEKLQRGRWEMKCSWSVGEKDFYKKVDLYL